MIRRPPRSTLFPYRRSSDLDDTHAPIRAIMETAATALGSLIKVGTPSVKTQLRKRDARSEEHTSELQSRRDLVCRLLLEKKKKKTKKLVHTTQKKYEHETTN